MPRAIRSATLPATAAWNEAQTSAMSWSVSGWSDCARTRTAVFNPANEKCSSARPAIGRGNGKRAGSPVAGGGFDGGAAGKAEAEQLGGLVECLAQRIVDGGAEALIAANAVHQLQLRVTAGDEQQEIRWCAGRSSARR